MAEQRRGVRPPVIDRRLAEELDQYRGLWVAIEDGHVVASAATLSEALDRARGAWYPDPLAYRVPRLTDRPLIPGH